MMFPNRINNAGISGRARSAAISAKSALLAVLAIIPTAHPTFPQTADKVPSADCQTGPETPENEQYEDWTQKLESGNYWAIAREEITGTAIPPPFFWR